MALFGVKLHAEYVVAMHGGGERTPILGGCQDVFVAIANGPVPVDVVEALLSLVGRDQRIGPGRADDRPSHMRKLEARVAAGVDLAHVCIDPAESGKSAFLASPAEQLHPETNAEHRDLPGECKLLQRLDPALAQRRHPSVERTDAGQDQPADAAQVGRTLDDLRFRISRLEHGSAAQGAQPRQ